MEAWRPAFGGRWGEAVGCEACTVVVVAALAPLVLRQADDDDDEDARAPLAAWASWGGGVAATVGVG